MRILLTGATGFVGRHLYPALVSAGHDVVCATRDVDAAKRRSPSQTWTEFDLERPLTIAAAMVGCDAACYLVHGMDDGDDYPAREARCAKRFATAADEAGLKRVVYLGGVQPTSGRVSKHLASRARTGEILRGCAVSTIELRAAMIIGAESASWMMVRDLAARLPAMLLPRWLANHSYPIAIDDVVAALLIGLTWPGAGSHVFDIPGPQRVAHRELLQMTANELGRTRLMLNVPILSPRLSSYWIALVTRIDLRMARELVEGVRSNLDPSMPILWDKVDHQPMNIEDAIRTALAAESGEASPAAVVDLRSHSSGSGS